MSEESNMVQCVEAVFREACVRWCGECRKAGHFVDSEWMRLADQIENCFPKEIEAYQMRLGVRSAAMLEDEK